MKIPEKCFVELNYAACKRKQVAYHPSEKEIQIPHSQQCKAASQYSKKIDPSQSRSRTRRGPGRAREILKLPRLSVQRPPVGRIRSKRDRGSVAPAQLVLKPELSSNRAIGSGCVFSPAGAA